MTIPSVRVHPVTVWIGASDSAPSVVRREPTASAGKEAPLGGWWTVNRGNATNIQSGSVYTKENLLQVRGNLIPG